MASYMLFSNRLLIVDLQNNFVYLAKFYRIIVYTQMYIQFVFADELYILKDIQ